MITLSSFKINSKIRSKCSTQRVSIKILIILAKSIIRIKTLLTKHPISIKYSGTNKTISYNSNFSKYRIKPIKLKPILTIINSIIFMRSETIMFSTCPRHYSIKYVIITIISIKNIRSYFISCGISSVNIINTSRINYLSFLSSTIKTISST